MPLYEYICDRCDQDLDAFLPVRDCGRRAAWPVCPACRRRDRIRRHYGPPLVAADFGEYYSIAMGAVNEAAQLPGETYDDHLRLRVRGRKHRRELMRRLNYVEQ